MGGIVGGAKLRGPPAGQALGLVAACEKGEFPGILVADFRQPQGGGAERLFPLNFAEFAAAPFTHPHQGF
jgi:hypothetical protein